jgi:hypothetical protein
MKTDQSKMNDPLPEDKIIKALDALIPGRSQSGHISDEDLGVFAELVTQSDLPAAEQKYPAIASHLKQCDVCAAMYLDLLTALQVPAAGPEAAAGLDLSFLQPSKQVWHSLGKDLWQLGEAVRLEIHEIRLQVQSSLAGLTWNPALLPVRGARGKQPSASAGDLVIPWPDPGLQIVLGLTQVLAGVQVTAQVLETASSQKVKDLTAFIVDDTRSRTYQARSAKAGALDFGIVPPGSYDLHLTVRSKEVRIPIEMALVKP